MRLSPGVPVLWRGDGSAQVGVRRPVRVDGDDARVAAALETGGLSAREMRRDHPALAARLRAGGLVEHEALGVTGPSVRIQGLGAAGIACATALAGAGVASLSLAGRDAAAGAAAVRGTGAAAPVQIDASRAVDGEVVVAAVSVGPVGRHALAVAAIPHVAVLTDEAGASVVPVRPGRTACLDCREHHLTDADPAWPALARQCEARPPWCDALTALVAGAVAASSLLALLAPGPPPLGVRVERGLVTPEPLAVHPRCGCGA